MTRSRLIILSISSLLIAAVGVRAQEPGKSGKKAPEKKMEMPKPGPEVKMLDYFVGNWHSEGDMKPSPWGPGGKFSGTSRCSWMSGGYFVVCNEEGSSPMGKMHGLGVMGYDANEKKYTYNGFNNMGENEHATGTADGKIWTYTSENMMNGKTIKGRYTITESLSTSYDFKLETSEDGNTWSSMMEGKATKAAAMEKKTEKKM